MKRLNKLTLENFRIFSQKAEFQFNDLNIYTGANNSGKSTIIKAIKLFSEGLKTSDFPYLNLISEELNLGSFKNNLNHDNEKKSFKIGLSVQIPGIEDEFIVVYTFAEGYSMEDEFKEYAIFSALGLYNYSGELFFQMRSHEASSDEKFENFIEDPFENNPGIISFRLNLDLLKKYLPRISNNPKKFENLINQFEKISSSDGYWWGECFSEVDYSYANYNLSKFYLRDFERELFYDLYLNIGDYSIREAIFCHQDDEMAAVYQELLEFTFYRDFINEIMHPLITSISGSLDTLRSSNVIHVSPEIIKYRLIPANIQSEYLQVIYRNQQESADFINSALSSFGIDGLTEVINHINTSFEVNLIMGIADFVEKKKKGISSSHPFLNLPPLYRINFEVFKTNPRINICDLGKGTASIILLILKIASVALRFQQEESIKIRLPDQQGRSPEVLIKKTILIEEPEAFLHPNWQSKLADFFVFCLEKYNVQFIIETHSTYLIQRLQYLVAKEEFDPKRINLLYFNQGSDAEKYYRINVRKDGILKESFGTGFYDETANLTAAILNSQNLN